MVWMREKSLKHELSVWAAERPKKGVPVVAESLLGRWIAKSYENDLFFVEASFFI